RYSHVPRLASPLKLPSFLYACRKISWSRSSPSSGEPAMRQVKAYTRAACRRYSPSNASVSPAWQRATSSASLTVSSLDGGGCGERCFVELSIGPARARGYGRQILQSLQRLTGSA